MMHMRKTTGFAFVAGLLLAGSVLAQPYGGGPGMMGGYGYGSGGGYGMGPGMMGGWGLEAYAGLKLSTEQKKQIAAIQQDSRKAMWPLMGAMHEQGYHMHDLLGPGALDEATARKAFQQLQETQKAMFELRLDARRKIDAVLTSEQREQLRR